MRRLSLAWFFTCASTFAVRLFCPIGFCCDGRLGVESMSLCVLIDAQRPDALSKWPYTVYMQRCIWILAPAVYMLRLRCGPRRSGSNIAAVFDSVQLMNFDKIKIKIKLTYCTVTAALNFKLRPQKRLLWGGFWAYRLKTDADLHAHFLWTLKSKGLKITTCYYQRNREETLKCYSDVIQCYFRSNWYSNCSHFRFSSK